MTKQLKLVIASIVLVLTILGLVFVTQRTSRESTEKLQIIASFYPAYAFTKAVVGDEAEVELLIEAGTEVHDFEPSSQAIAKIQSADAFVYISDQMEVWLPKVADAIDMTKANVVEASHRIVLMESDELDHDNHDDIKEASHEHEEHEEDHDDHHHELDPHVWLSPKKAMTLVETIRDELIKDFPEKRAVFEQNASDYIADLEALDAEYHEALANAQHKDIVTQHAAFAYLTEEYGLHQVAIAGINAEAEPSAKRLAELSEFVKTHQVEYIYFEENVSSKVAQTLAAEVGVKTAVLNPLESLTRDQMAKGDDYFSVMRANLKALRLTTDSKNRQ